MIQHVRQLGFVLWKERSETESASAVSGTAPGCSEHECTTVRGTHDCAVLVGSLVGTPHYIQVFTDASITSSLPQQSWEHEVPHAAWDSCRMHWGFIGGLQCVVATLHLDWSARICLRMLRRSLEGVKQ